MRNCCGRSVERVEELGATCHPHREQLLELELNNVQYDEGESPEVFFARIFSMVNKLRLVGVEKTPEQVLEVMADQLPPRFRIEKAILRYHPATTTQLVEETIGDAYAEQRPEEI